MPIKYSPLSKAARLEAVRALLDGGRLLLGDEQRYIASIEFRSPCGGIFNDLLHMTGAPFITAAKEDGTLSRALLVTRGGETVASGLTVGLSDADIIVDRVEVKKGSLIKLDSVDLRHS